MRITTIILLIFIGATIACRNTRSDTNDLNQTPLAVALTPSSLKTSPANGTPTLTNQAILQIILKTPQPTPLATALMNEFDIRPGISSKSDVLRRLGEPLKKLDFFDLEFWSYRTFRGIKFSSEFVEEIADNADPERTTDEVVEAFGAPEIVAFIPTDLSLHHVPPENVGILVYPSKGIRFTFGCSPPSVPCRGVPHFARVYEKAYFRPMTLSAWMQSHWVVKEQQPNRFYIRPWTGFLEQ